MKDLQKVDGNFFEDIKSILQNARENVYKKVNFVMVEAYWSVGKKIVLEEQNGEDRAKYGSYLIEELSKRLTTEFGKGFSKQNLWNMRQFYNTFPILSTLCGELSWSHYKLLIRVENKTAREWYMDESAKANWSVRALERQINSLYFERLLSSKEKEPIRLEARKNTQNMAFEPTDIIKDPYVLEFLDLKDNKKFRESELEGALIDKIQDFLLELGRGFAFVARQKRIKTQNSDFFIDLVFYNYLLKCFVIVDLKIGALTHQDIGQLDMYVNMFDDLEKSNEDNPTIGIILCTDKDKTIIKYSNIKDKNLFVSKYKLYLPSEEELVKELSKI